MLRASHRDTPVDRLLLNERAGIVAEKLIFDKKGRAFRLAPAKNPRGFVVDANVGFNPYIGSMVIVALPSLSMSILTFTRRGQ